MAKEDNKLKLSTDRRSMLKMLGVAGLAAGATAHVRAGSVSDKKPQADGSYDVIIVGAGFTGITAARDLGEKGYKVLILEAQNRIGGRTFATEFNGHGVELGGTWVHWSQPHIWAEVNRYDAELKEMPAAQRWILLSEEGKAKDLDLATAPIKVMQAFSTILHDAKAIWERPYDQDYTWEQITKVDHLSVVDRLDEFGITGETRKIIESQMLALGQQPISEFSYVELSRLYSLAGWNIMTLFEASARYKLKDGTQGLLEQMLADANCDLQLSTVITDVIDHADGVSVTTEDGVQYSAKSAIVTVPFNALSQVSFTPSLPEKKQALINEGMGTRGYKTFIEVEGDLDNVVGMGPSDTMLPSFFTYDKFENSTLLVGFGIEYEQFDPNDTAVAQEAISKFFPDAKVKNVFGYAWSLDPFAQGFHCIYRKGQLSKIGNSFNQFEGKMIITGADHCDGWRGFIDGAVATGSVAANHLHGLLGGAKVC